MRRVLIWPLRLFAIVFAFSFLAALASATAAGLARGRIRSEGDETSDEAAVVAIYEGARLRSRAARFRRGRVLAWFGGASLDLREATLDPAGASVSLQAAWGGANVAVPDGWRIDFRGIGIFGGATNLARDEDLPPDAPTLEVNAFALFGGAAVSHLADPG